MVGGGGGSVCGVDLGMWAVLQPRIWRGTGQVLWPQKALPGFCRRIAERLPAARNRSIAHSHSCIFLKPWSITFYILTAMLRFTHTQESLADQLEEGYRQALWLPSKGRLAQQQPGGFYAGGWPGAGCRAACWGRVTPAGSGRTQTAWRLLGQCQAARGGVSRHAS